jgi:hypothetical protein
MASPLETNLSDTSAWLPLNGLQPGFDAYKGETSSDLNGLTLTTTWADGTQIDHAFKNERMHWLYLVDNGDRRGSDPYEVFLIDEGLYYVQFQRDDRPIEAPSILFDLTNGVGLAVISTIEHAEPGMTAVRQRFEPFTIEGYEQKAPLPAPSQALIGRRVYWRYSPLHAYEHVYLSPQWYTWHCLSGPERGLADTDEHTTFEIRPGIYVFAWREKVIPCASVTVANHRDFENLRSHGALFGLDDSGTETVHFTFGANGAVLGTVEYPDDLDPTRAS